VQSFDLLSALLIGALLDQGLDRHSVPDALLRH
jgi:hypothetical protein